jgi:uncharacterized protein
MVYTWRGIQTPSIERLRITAGEQIRVRSTVQDGGERYDYEVTLSADWTFHALEIRSHDSRNLYLSRDDDGAWSINGQPRPDLAKAVDIDLAFSPFTNTLPIRRLNLAIGSAAEITTAYVDVPSLQVSCDSQRYTRTAVDQYLYESLDSDFTRQITVDSEGFVTDYPGLFKRDIDAE